MDVAPKTEKIALALGSNLGDRMAALRAAVENLPSCITIEKVSPVYETRAAYVSDQPDFLNAALTGTTKLEPLAFLWSLKKLEVKLGRRPTFHYGPRAIDIDILFYGDQILTTRELILPHPRLAEREFVLRPLADIAPGWKHPQAGLTVAEMLSRMADHTATRLHEVL
jgi:2-amino-4-hydroxy-6-hydroxymethyldihydropteridine diphosphokinase